MALIYNALENGWAIKKHRDNRCLYYLERNHEGKKGNIFPINIYRRFMKENFDY